MKKIIPILIIVIIVAGGIGWVIMKRNQAPVSQTTGEESSNQKKTKEFNGSLKAAIALGVPMKCTWKTGDFSNTGYIKGKKYYGEINQGGQKMRIIIKDNCMWSWELNSPQGIKNCFDNEETLWEKQESQENNNNVHCVPTAISDSKFNPPANVKFLTYENLMQQFGE